MKTIFLLLAVLSLTVAPACAKEAFVSLEDYATRAEAIVVCAVEKDNGDSSITANITEVIKGSLGETEVIRGETGHCISHGPVSHFMKPKKKYLVFLFKDNAVGRLGGILEVEEGKTLLITSIHGFTGTDFDKEAYKRTLPIEDAKQQIQAILLAPAE